MEQKTSLAKSTLPYGIIFGIIMILEYVVSYTMGLTAQNSPSMGTIMFFANNIIMPFIFILLACNNFKKNLNEGYISFGQCIKGGVAVCVVAGLLFAVFNSVFYLIIPEAKDEMLEQTKIALAQNPNMTAELMKQSIEMTKLFMKPYVSIPFSILMFSFVGLIISLIVGAFVKKDNPGAIN
ncbi:DUF4199 family protein [Flavobacterium rakeshii]|uniref:DUF4199 family protein n=1 Tax=Flavobacterium rakeshii TaxID=1038845 RepID=A0A6N8HD44_9FLAO|nr:DUF4199 domain-containing protein [Flavobacterium rakeshii]MEE1897155.1 DUF4199 domain-containing protein [Flavobacterium rakeshii]MUV03236.1 DUF4199 family protein [Flavobacterium rakeshii]